MQTITDRDVRQWVNQTTFVSILSIFDNISFCLMRDDFTCQWNLKSTSGTKRQDFGTQPLAWDGFATSMRGKTF